ncbi:unnamed protein product [Didymodactylos carnosus]|uniref:Tyrosine-protein kinase ephrin type A/B receptor-like domain-containing protein n=1 Tax=Didymodactylos carnosus TaxID=1234261 RepID=A0A8S2FL12_9BILA|nr:unnamed protein product [Didymodactylos carnosus]CAF4276203.1 unnamed protein product [Didymodactylos carnosus]
MLCLPSYYCPDGIESLPCSPGIFSFNHGQSSCSSCSTGFHVAYSGSTQCSVCPKGHYCARTDQLPIPCPPGEYSGDGYTSCAKCSTEYYNTYLNSTICYPCPPDFYCDNAAACSNPCSAGGYSTSLSTSYDKCGQCGSIAQIFDCASCARGKNVNRIPGKRSFYLRLHTNQLINRVPLELYCKLCTLTRLELIIIVNLSIVNQHNVHYMEAFMLLRVLPMR